MIFVPVLGMHRSGTSCVAGIIQRLGVYLGEPEDMVPSNSLNPKGYNELFVAVRANDKLLETVRASWEKPPNLDVRDNWLKKFRGKHSYGKFLLQMSLKYLQLGAQNMNFKAFGLKDPRLLMTFPLWLDMVPKNVKTKGIIVDRPAHAVLKSWIAAHNLEPGLARRAHVMYMRWLKQNLVRYSFDRITVSYEALLRNPRGETLRIAKFLFGNISDTQLASAVAYVDPSLNRPGSKKTKLPERDKKEDKKKKKPALKKSPSKKK